jgi:hypothetical protein
MNPLQVFYLNETQRDAVHNFMVEVLREITVEKAFDGEDVSGIKEARNLVEKMFEKLEEQYGIKEKPVIANSK